MDVLQKQGKSSAHGEPLGEDNLKTTREFLKWTDEEEVLCS